MKAFLRRVSRWAAQRDDVRAIALVGSWARGAPGMESDVDVVLLTDSPASYVERDDWVGELGGGDVVRTLSWGAVTERRVRLAGGLEVEFDVAAPTWAAVDELDEGTRKVVADGMTAVYDPDLLLARLLAAC